VAKEVYTIDVDKLKVYVTFEDGGLKVVEWKRRRDVNVRCVETICYLDKIRIMSNNSEYGRLGLPVVDQAGTIRHRFLQRRLL